MLSDQCEGVRKHRRTAYGSFMFRPFAAAVFTCFTLLGTGAGSSQEATFAGKNVRMILGQAAGGGADTSARLIATFLGKYLPGNPTVIVVNMPGANGIVANNYLVHQVAADGLTFIAGSGSQIIAAAERNSAVKYDPAKFEFIGSVQNPGTVLIAAKTAIPRLTNPKADAVVMAQVGVARPGALFTIWGKEFLNWNVRSVTGYKGSQEVHLAVLRGEAEMMDTGAINVLGPMVNEGKYAGVSQIGLFSGGKFVRRETFRDVPLISEQLEGKVDARALSGLKSWLNAAAIGKFYALAPGTPAPLVAAYRSAFTRMQDDPDFQEKARTALDPDYEMMSAEDTRQLVAAVMGTSDQDREFLAQLREKHGLQSEASR
jgi:tripartite-type tricarboxylate transporter receptor subunit TctC